MSDIRKKAEAAGEAIGDLASSAGQTISGLFGRAKEMVKEKIGNSDDEAMTALKALVAAQDGLSTAITMGDDAGIQAAKQTLAEAWSVARKVASE